MKQEPRYFEIILTSSPKVGMLFGPDNVEWSSTIDGKPLEKKDYEVELRGGQFPDYITSSKCVRIVSPAMRKLFEEYCTDKSALEFFPIKVVSKELGDRMHYIMHLTKVYDVLNPDCSIYAEAGHIRSMTIPGIDKAKAEGLNILNIRPFSDELIISDEMRRAINRNKLNSGITYMELPCE